VMCVGLVRADQIVLARAEGVGNPVFYVGNKTGRDGIHGATMASATFDDSAAERRPTVQVGDPFTEKLLLEACLEAMKTGAVVGIQDMGAAGLACCTSEMPARAGTGMDVELSRVPQREVGMTPYEILLSESQERMLLVAARGREDEVRRIFAKWELDAVEIGRVTAGGTLTARLSGEVVAHVPLSLLAEAPKYTKPTAPPGWLTEPRALEIPVVGGNVSFYNETNGQAILPTPVIGVVGILEDAGRRATQWFKGAGHRVALLGPDHTSLGGSEYLWRAHRRLGGRLAPL